MENKTKCIKTGNTWEGIPVLNTMCDRYASPDEDCFKSPGAAISIWTPPLSQVPSNICPACADKIIEIISNAKPKNNSYIETDQYKEDRLRYETSLKNSFKKTIEQSVEYNLWIDNSEESKNLEISLKEKGYIIKIIRTSSSIPTIGNKFCLISGYGRIKLLFNI